MMRLTLATFAALVLAILLVAPTTAAQVTPSATPPAAARLQLRVDGVVQRVLTSADLAALPHETVRARDHHGSEGTFSGVPVESLLRLVGVPAGDSLRGAGLARYVLVEAADRYRVVFSFTGGRDTPGDPSYVYRAAAPT